MESSVMTEREKKVITQLFELVKQNPELDVITMVDTEVVASDDYDMWRGWLDEANIEEVIDGEDAIHVRGKSDPDTIIVDFINSGEASYKIIEDYDNAIDVRETEAILDELPWKRVILLHIST